MKQVKLDQVASIWECIECGGEEKWTFENVAEAGSPTCCDEECDYEGEDMVPAYALVDTDAL